MKNIRNFFPSFASILISLFRSRLLFFETFKHFLNHYAFKRFTIFPEMSISTILTKASLKRREIMKKAAFILVFFTLFTSLTFFKPIISYACSCIQAPPVEEEFKRVTAVFSGKVIEISDESVGMDPIKVTFQVSRIWKGISEVKVSIYTGRDSAGCGYPFEEGDSYLIYAVESEGKLTTGLCSLTKELSLAEGDISVLGEGKMPSDSNNKATKEQSIQSIYWILLSTVLVGSIGFTLYKVLRKE
jgi:hypothetical protein